jgi:hypothetical protein
VCRAGSRLSEPAGRVWLGDDFRDRLADPEAVCRITVPGNGDCDQRGFVAHSVAKIVVQSPAPLNPIPTVTDPLALSAPVEDSSTNGTRMSL